MAVETDADRAAYLADFGVTAIYGGSSFTVIYDRPYVDTGDMAGYAPEAMARTADVTSAGVEVGEAITIDGTAFTVRRIEPDGTGMTVLGLEAA